MKILEYFTAAAAPQSLADTALRTADSGYLTRRLVDVSDVIIREDDCGDKRGLWVNKIAEYQGNKEAVVKFEERLVGRYTVEVINPATGEIIVPADTMISEEQATEIKAAGIERSISVRSSTQASHGACVKCYGADLSSGRPVHRGAVGIIAAQSIGERYPAP